MLFTSPLSGFNVVSDGCMCRCNISRSTGCFSTEMIKEGQSSEMTHLQDVHNKVENEQKSGGEEKPIQ